MQQKHRRVRIFIVGLALLAGIYYLGLGGSNPGVLSKLTRSAGSYPLVRVSDGDTIVVDMEGKEEKIRLIGVDTPEKNDDRKPVQCYARTASSYTKEFLKGGEIILEADSLGDNRDKYGRLLRYVYIPGDGVSLDEHLVQGGYGFTINGFSYSKKKLFQADEHVAENSKVGLWGSCEVLQDPVDKNRRSTAADPDQSR